MTRDAGYDDWLDAVADGESSALVCANGHGSLPPRRICPHCGSRDLAETPLPESGTVASHTTVHVPTPQFEGDAPYVVAVADFDVARVTGRLDCDPDDATVGLPVGIGAGETAAGDRLLVLQPR